VGFFPLVPIVPKALQNIIVGRTFLSEHYDLKKALKNMDLLVLLYAQKIYKRE